MDDIEDIGALLDSAAMDAARNGSTDRGVVSHRHSEREKEDEGEAKSKSAVIRKGGSLRRRRRRYAWHGDESKVEQGKRRLAEEARSVVPGTQSVYVKTWGCSHNNSDGEYMSGQLASYGYTITDDRKAADVWLLNSCTVKDPSQAVFVNAIRQGQEQGKRVVLAGCVSQAQPNLAGLEDLSIIGVQQIDRVVEVVEETLKGHTVRMLGQKKGGGARLHLPKIRKNPLIEIIPINTGCLNQCTYCKTKHARGDLRSYMPDEIVQRVEAVLKEGVVEIWLTSEDLGTYGRDIGHTLPELLWRIVDVLPDYAMLRCGMTNPPYILEHLDEMCRILNHPQVYAFLHVPVQAASDHVLYDMRRKYTCAEFCRVVEALEANVQDMTVATDIICGFPTETREDFEETLDLVRKYKFPIINISQFYPRAGTPAARLKRVPTQEVKRRSRALTQLFEGYMTRDHKVGLVQRVLVTQEARDGVNWVAHNKSYDQVLVSKTHTDVLGKMIDVRIVRAGKHYIVGEVLRDSLQRAPQALVEPLPAGQVSQTHKDDAKFDGAADPREAKSKNNKIKKNEKRTIRVSSTPRAKPFWSQPLAIGLLLVVAAVSLAIAQKLVHDLRVHGHN